MTREDLWELDESHQPSHEAETLSLEQTLAKVRDFLVSGSTSPPGKQGAPISDHEIIRESATDDVSVTIRSIPRVPWETIRYITAKHAGDKNLSKKSVAEGCMVHCGLAIVEHIVKQSPRGEQEWLQAYESGDVDIQTMYVNQRYVCEYMGRGIGQTKKLYFLNLNDKARAMHVANTYGLPLGEVVVICLVAGIAQSESLIPRRYVDAASKEMERFKKYLRGEVQGGSKKTEE